MDMAQWDYGARPVRNGNIEFIKDILLTASCRASELHK